MLHDYQNETQRSARIERINELEHNADRVTHETVALLQTIVVTPLDRDDIHRLISRMDDILDLMQDAGELCREIDGRESEADRVMRAAISKLFRLQHA